MKKIFTLICALVGIVASGFAQTVADLEVCKHSYVLVGDDVTNNGTEKIAKNSLFGDGYFFTPTGHDKSNKKNSFDLAEKNEDGTYKWFNGKYAEYGSHLNSLRLKKEQNVFAIKLTAKSKIIICFNGQSKTGKDARYPKFATDAKLTTPLNDAPTAESGTVGISTVEYTAPDDMTLYVGSWNGDIYVSYIIVEANEIPGTPSVKVGPQTYENGLWFREVTVKSAMVSEEGTEEQFPSIVTYTTDGSAPDEKSEVVPSDPIKVYKDQTLKFQAFMDFGSGVPDVQGFLSGAENEAVVSFSFDAPTITADKGNVTVTTPYAAQGGANVITYGDKTINGDNATLTESAVVSAKTVITNGTYGKFDSKSASIDALVLTPIKEKKEIKPIAGEVVIDEEATAGSTDGKTYYKVENGKHNADPKYIFFKKPVFGAVTADNTKYQVPEGQEVYLQMKDNDIAIYFETAQKSLVTITASKNSCKNIDKPEDAKNLIFGVKMDDTDQQVADITADHEFVNGDATETLSGNVLKFFVEAGTHKITRYTGTGNIFLSSIVIEPAGTNTGINDIEANSTVKVKKVIENGQIVIVKGNNKYNVAGAQIK
ncbi:MAG: chitobiase/beta-hexosaminidase C-terminal domain-containing protein [Prevotella sp.]|nr:chitobiase/beta-hexosaminidase C-terminal domain-containing protein [Prevotella sp.]